VPRGFFDHVPPTTAPIPQADQAAGNQDGLRGFRVPCLVVSPYSGGGAVSSVVLDHTSVLRMIEWRWGLEPLTERDATANNLAEALEFKARAHKALAPAAPDKWQGLLAMSAALGWK
jgi:phospholipase C